MSKRGEGSFRLEKGPGAVDNNSNDFSYIEDLPNSPSKDKLKDLLLRLLIVYNSEKSQEQKDKMVGWFSGIHILADELKKDPELKIEEENTFKDLDVNLKKQGWNIL